MRTGIFSSSPAIRIRHLQAWALSLSLHALAVAGALTLFASVRLAPQPEPFRWTVSLTEGTAMLPQSSGLEQPAESAPASPSVLASADDAISPTIKTRPMPQAHPQPIVPAVSPVEKPVTTAHQPVITRPTPQDSATSHVTTAATQTAPPVVEQTPVQRPVQAITQPVPTHQAIVEPSVITKAPAVAQPVPAPAPQTTPAPEPRPVVAGQPVESVQAKLVEPPPLSQTPVVETPRPLPSSLPQEVASVPRTVAPETSQLAPAVAAPAQTVESEQVSSEASPPPVQARSAERSSHKPDYGWLADALWKRIENLKQYPQQARLNRLEGRVVLRVVIADDGSLQDLAVAKSSGHSVLDEDALEVLRRAAPLTLIRPLGKSRVVVQVPISYRLDR